MISWVNVWILFFVVVAFLLYFGLWDAIRNAWREEMRTAKLTNKIYGRKKR